MSYIDLSFSHEMIIENKTSPIKDIQIFFHCFQYDLILFIFHIAIIPKNIIQRLSLIRDGICG